MTNTTDRDVYGTKERNGLVDAQSYHNDRHSQETIDTVDWTTKGLRVTRLRLLSDPGFPAWDVSYCHGILDGKHVDVQLPFDQLPKYKGSITKHIIEYAKKDGVYAKGLGILSCISTLN